MHIKRSSRPMLALGGLTAAVALLASLPQADAQAPAPGAPLSGAGSFPGSFIVPGTNTSLRVGGFIQLDTNYNFSAFSNATSPGALDNINPNSTQLQGNGFTAQPAGADDHGIFRMTSQNTRAYLETRTPTAYGELKTYLEFDFAGNTSSGAGGATSVGATQTPCCANNSIVRIRQAYGAMGPWLFGMTNSNFADLAAWGDSLDAPVQAGGFMGVGVVRTPQIRYTWLLPYSIAASASVESYQTGGIISPATTGVGAFTINNFNAPGYGEKFPALTGKVQTNQPWGHAGFQLAIAENRLRNLAAAGTLFPAASNSVGGHQERWGYMMAQTGHFNTFGNDKLTWQFAYGQGLGQYSWALNELGTQWEESLVCSVGGTAGSFSCSQPRVMGVNAGYTHNWTDEWRTNVGLGYDQVSRPNAAGPWNPVLAGNGLTTLERKHYSAGATMFWKPIPAVQFGLEYLWYHRTVWSGAHGSFNRLAGQALFAF